jgi:hypothetical protein
LIGRQVKIALAVDDLADIEPSSQVVERARTIDRDVCRVPSVGEPNTEYPETVSKLRKHRLT